MKIEKVKPYYNKKETIYVFLTILIILITSITLISLTVSKENKETLNINQISSFESFNNNENNIYLEIYNFLNELEFAKDEGYKSIEELKDENNSLFFNEDFIWKYEKYNNINYYLGISKNENIGNFLISSYIEGENVKSNIFYYKGKIENGSSIENILEEFKEVVPLKGSDVEGNL